LTEEDRRLKRKYGSRHEESLLFIGIRAFIPPEDLYSEKDAREALDMA
jgi:hypothetical protein